MLQRLTVRPPFAFSLLTSTLWMLGSIGQASAHVKWFCAFDVAGQPVGLANVLCPDFEELTALTIFVLVAAGIIERTPLGTALLRSIVSFMAPVRL